MAILYGTTSDGNTLPVQVNASGQLVAQGVEGPAGPQGPEGPIGPVGEVEFTSGTFAPVFTSSDPAGEVLDEYDQQEGYWYRFGPLLTVQIRLRATQFIITNARGYALVSGLPAEARFARPSGASSYGPSQVWSLNLSTLGEQVEPKCLWNAPQNNFKLYCIRDERVRQLGFADLSVSDGGPTNLIMSFSGLAADAVRSVPGFFDDLISDVNLPSSMPNFDIN
jgi:hypothetical protein